jgi:hypothetical protein
MEEMGEKKFAIVLMLQLPDRSAIVIADLIVYNQQVECVCVCLREKLISQQFPGGH